MPPTTFRLPLSGIQGGAGRAGKQQEGGKAQHGTAALGTMPTKTRASSVESNPTRSQWLVKTKYEMHLLIGLLALQMTTNYFAFLLTSSPDGFQVAVLYL